MDGYVPGHSTRYRRMTLTDTAPAVPQALRLCSERFLATEALVLREPFPHLREV
jgi:hypothetical protein